MSDSTPDKPRVNVIMNCFNSSKYLREAIDSVYSQTYPDWEIIFLDNASTDSSADIAKSYGPKIRYFRNSETVPLGMAREQALDKADSEHLAFLDCDDKWAPLKLERQLSFLSDNPDALLCYSGYSTINEDGAVTGRRRPEFLIGDLFGRNLANYEVNFQTLMIRREALALIGRPYFNPSLKFCPDHNMVMRILSRGRAICLPDLLVYYRRTAGSLTQKSIHLWGDEVEYTYKQLESAGVLDRISTPGERKLSRAKTAYFKAQYLVHKGDYSGARQMLGDHKFADSRYFLLYLLSWSPMLWKAAHRLRA